MVLNTGHAGKSLGVVWHHGSGLPLQRRYLRPPLHDRILEQYRTPGHDRILECRNIWARGLLLRSGHLLNPLHDRIFRAKTYLWS